MAIRCPHCRKSLGGGATEGGLRLRLGIVLIDPDDGVVHGPCPSCKGDVIVASEANIPAQIAGQRRRIIPGVRVKTS